MTKERILWIDVAKGIAIVLMIIGHTVQFGTPIRNFIFSFHMPLFFMLSGYTIKIPIVEECKWCDVLNKDIVRLLFPYLSVSFLSCIYEYCIKDNISFSETVLNWGERVFWGCGVNYLSHPAVGMLWFLIVLFWGKQIYRLIVCVLKRDFYVNLLIVFFPLVACGLRLLPQSLDIALVALFYIHLGRLLKMHIITVHNNMTFICFFSGMYWAVCLYNNIYIEMAKRSYPFLFVSIFEAFAGSLCIIYLSHVIIDKNNSLCSFFQWAGINSLTILCLHSMDEYVKWIWKVNSILISCLIRILIVFLLLHMFLLLTKSQRHFLKNKNVI